MENVRTPKERAEEVVGYVSIVQTSCVVKKDDLLASDDVNTLVDQTIHNLVVELLNGIKSGLTIESYPTADTDAMEFRVSLCIIPDRNVFAAVTTTAFEMAERDLRAQLGYHH